MCSVLTFIYIYGLQPNIFVKGHTNTQKNNSTLLLVKYLIFEMFWTEKSISQMVKIWDII